MADLRIGRGWTEAELEARLAGLPARPRNFAAAPDEMTLERGWHQYFSEAVIGREPPGPPVPDGPFTRGRIAVSAYAFSDPRIVIGHFDPDVPLLGRYMLLEMRALRAFHYLAGVVVAATRHDEADGEAGPETVFGFRYDTLQGHIESGFEWFLLRKAHATGDIRFRIEAAWRPGQFPNWWSRLGFAYLGPRYQRKWHHRAHAILALLLRDPAVAAPEPERGERLVHADPTVVFQRFRAPRLHDV